MKEGVGIGIQNRATFCLCSFLTILFTLTPVQAEVVVTLDARPGVTQSVPIGPEFPARLAGDRAQKKDRRFHAGP